MQRVAVEAMARAVTVWVSVVVLALWLVASTVATVGGLGLVGIGQRPRPCCPWIDTRRVGVAAACRRGGRELALGSVRPRHRRAAGLAGCRRRRSERAARGRGAGSSAPRQAAGQSGPRRCRAGAGLGPLAQFLQQGAAFGSSIGRAAAAGRGLVGRLGCDRCNTCRAELQHWAVATEEGIELPGLCTSLASALMADGFDRKLIEPLSSLFGTIMRAGLPGKLVAEGLRGRHSSAPRAKIVRIRDHPYAGCWTLLLPPGIGVRHDRDALCRSTAGIWPAGAEG